MHSSDHQTVTQHAEMEERTIMKVMLLLVSNNYYNLFIIRIKRVYGNIYDGPQNPWNHSHSVVWWVFRRPWDCLSTVNEKQFLSDLIEFGKAVIVKRINKAHNTIIWRSWRNIKLEYMRIITKACGIDCFESIFKPHWKTTCMANCTVRQNNYSKAWLKECQQHLPV